MKLVENYDQERKGEKFVWQNKLAVVKVAVLIYNGKKIQGYCLPEIFQREQ